MSELEPLVKEAVDEVLRELDGKEKQSMHIKNLYSALKCSTDRISELEEKVFNMEEILNIKHE